MKPPRLKFGVPRTGREARAQALVRSICHWTPVDLKYPANDDAYYATTCGEAFKLPAGGPSAHRMNYCPACGRHLQVMKPEAQETA